MELERLSNERLCSSCDVKWDSSQAMEVELCPSCLWLQKLKIDARKELENSYRTYLSHGGLTSLSRTPTTSPAISRSISFDYSVDALPVCESD